MTELKEKKIEQINKVELSGIDLSGLIALKLVNASTKAKDKKKKWYVEPLAILIGGHQHKDKKAINFAAVNIHTNLQNKGKKSIILESDNNAFLGEVISAIKKTWKKN